MIVLILFGIIYLLAFLAFITGLTLYDLREIRLDKELRRHPYAKKWRRRPLVSVIVDGEPTREHLQNTKGWNYRKIQVVSKGSPIDGELILSLPPGDTIDKFSVLRAVRQLNADSSISQVELMPVIRSTETVRGLLASYRRIATAPFAASRSGLGVSLPHSTFPILARAQTMPLSNRSRLYLLLRWIVQIMNVFTVAYVIYLALAVHQPDIVLAYLLAFSSWLIWSIARYRQLTFVRKIGLLGLAPVSFGSFLYRCILAPLRLRQYAALLPRRRRSVIIATIHS